MADNHNFFFDLKNSFYSELVGASQGHKTSLLYSKTTPPVKLQIEDRTQFQVMVVGGTNFVSATMLRQDGVLPIFKTTKQKTPVLDCTKTLVRLIIEHLEPETKIVALNFAFRINPVIRENILDGILLSGSKGHILADLIGKIVGFEVENEIFKKMGRKVTVAVCNDTVSLGLAGLDFLERNRQSHQKIAVAIVGTGFNSGFFDASNSFINLESANFNNFKHSQSLDILDQSSSTPGQNMFDKELAGRYLPKHFNLLSAQNGLNITVKDSQQLSELAQKDHSKAGQIARQLIQKSANMVATHMAAIADFILKSEPKEKLNFFVEGSVFWKAFEFEKKERLALTELSDKEIEIHKIENSAIVGAARLIG